MTSISPPTITIRGKALVRRALKEKMLRTKRFASENIQEEETQEGDDFEYISLPKKQNFVSWVALKEKSALRLWQMRTRLHLRQSCSITTMEILCQVHLEGEKL